jgi:TatD DNase family protein
VLCCLLASLPQEKREEFKAIKYFLSSSGFPVRNEDALAMPKLPFIDSHFHLDQTLVRCKLKNFGALVNQTEPGSPLQIDLVVANYVYPRQWVRWCEQVEDHPGVRVSFGVHPHFIVESSIEMHIRQLDMLLCHPLCVGLGEVGMDLTSRCRCLPVCTPQDSCLAKTSMVQEKFLRAVLPLCAKHQKALILHCRDKGTNEASIRTLRIIQDLGLEHLPIHRHCFTSDQADADRWIEVCPNVKFGFTATILQHPPTQEVIKKLSCDRIMLESDAPYLPVNKVGVNTPWQMMPVVNYISELKNLPPSLLLKWVNANARQLYSM